MSRFPAIICFILFPFFLMAQSALEYNRLGEQKMTEGDIYSSLEYYSRSIELNPRYHQSLYGISKAYFYLGEYDAAKFYIGLAKNLSESNSEYLNLEGRINVGLGDLDEAYKIFMSILDDEPYNLPASLGIAEIDLIENRYSEAEQKYLDTLTISPESRRALLSLLILYDSSGEYSKGDEILEKLNRSYSYDPDVKLAAASHYYRSGNLLKAEENALILFSINSNSDEVRPLLAKIYLEKDEAEKAVSFLEEQLRYDRDNLQLRYLLAVSYSRINRITESLHNYDFILKNAPYDEISRLSAEALALEYNISDKMEEYGRYHYLEGKKYENQFRYDRALNEYRRALRINPGYIDGRLAYGGIYKKQGYTGKYLDILDMLEWNGYDDSEFLSMKKQLEHLKERTIADVWQIDQFNLSKNTFLMDIYIRKPDIQSFHNLSEGIIGSYFSYELERIDRIVQNGPARIIKNNSDAYRKSHNSGSQYYIIIDFTETERVFTMSVSMYLSRTGILLDSFSVLRAGNGKVADSVRQSVEFVRDFIPFRSGIVAIENGVSLINGGSLDGVSVEQKFLIVRKGSAAYISEAPYYEVSDEDKLGLLTITSVDESVSEGVVTNPGFLELVNPGDELFLLDKDDEVILEPDYGYNRNLKRELLRIF